MNKNTIGLILIIIGAIATVVTGIQALQDSESFKFLGMDVAVSSANWVPLIVSVAVLVVGIVLKRS